MQQKGDEATNVAVVPEEMVERAVDAVVALIIQTLSSKEPGKFMEAARLCNIGQSLMRTRAKRVSDFAALEVPALDDGGVNLNQGYGNFGGGAADQQEVERNRALTFGPVAQVTAEAQRATVAAQEAAELQTLSALAPTPAIQERIAILNENMEVRNRARRPNAQVVPADVPRGPAPGEEGPQADVGPGVRPDADGGARNGEAPGVRRFIQALEEAVGEGR